MMRRIRSPLVVGPAFPARTHPSRDNAPFRHQSQKNLSFPASSDTALDSSLPGVAIAAGIALLRTTADLPSPLAAGMMTAASQTALRDREFAEPITAGDERTGSTSTTNPTHTSSSSSASPPVKTIEGTAVDDIDLTGMEPVPEVAGLADTWWRGEDAVIAIYPGRSSRARIPCRAACDHLRRYPGTPDLPRLLIRRYG
ncbi:hypothetical protein GCM10010399_48190 [Dactylosporangium fulvum]|uniref:Uncharacterized protein n=1 Tax=Dactylosporangium fulvum TaxID=53359 RepID=A0ABY5VTZ9_9ACTN|nr:hypothetical protein [Dactylosporangium fulvum]UWP80554.1 hypothetical protein Dfulv_36110 [Dactylosporangium fulvum]